MEINAVAGVFGLRGRMRTEFLFDRNPLNGRDFDLVVYDAELPEPRCRQRLLYAWKDCPLLSQYVSPKNSASLAPSTSLQGRTGGWEESTMRSSSIRNRSPCGSEVLSSDFMR